MEYRGVGSGMQRLALTLQKRFAEAQRDSKWIGDFPLLVNEVCVGLGGLRKFMNYAGVDYDTRCCDKEARYKRFYEEVVKEDPEAYLETKIGADGDLLLASDAGDADGLVGGSPCTPWDMHHKQDAQSRVFLRAVDQVIALATDGSLTFCALENSPNIGTVLRGEKTSFLSDMLDRLNAALSLIHISEPTRPY